MHRVKAKVYELSFLRGKKTRDNKSQKKSLTLNEGDVKIRNKRTARKRN